MWEFKWPVVGIIVPCVLISTLAYGSHYFVFQHQWDSSSQLWFQFYVSMIWLTYILAIFKSPGSPKPGYKVPGSEWKRWCKKCNNYKPERAHHCRKCGICVLQMDHHCPWTNNCVGHDNMPHFMRFLVWVVFTTGLTMVRLGSRAFEFYQERNIPAYLVRKSELAAVIVLLPLDSFVFLSVGLLLIRCLLHITSGKSQIEVWEFERIESQLHTERLWLKIRHNYRVVHGKDMPVLTSWNPRSVELEQMGLRSRSRSRSRSNSDSDSQSDSDLPTRSSSPRFDPISEIVPEGFGSDDIIFPYDNGIFSNLFNALNYPWIFVLPWGSARGDGHKFPKNDDDDQLNLPWPPDGGDVDFEGRTLTDEELRQLKNMSLVRKHLDPKSNMPRSEWTNGLGESLVDYGVDMDAEEEKGVQE